MNDKKSKDYSHPDDPNPVCGIGIIDFGDDRACKVHDAEDVARKLKEIGVLSVKENDERFAKGILLEAENQIYPVHSSGFARFWNVRRAYLFGFIAKFYSRWLRRS